MEQVIKGKATPSQGEDNKLRREKSDSQIMWHSSRETLQKQWNETRVVALDGAAKILRIAMSHSAVLQGKGDCPLFLMLVNGGSDGVWRRKLSLDGVAVAWRDRELAFLGALAVFELLTAAGYVAEENSKVVVVFAGRVRPEVNPAREASQSLVLEAIRRWRWNKVVIEDTTAVNIN